MQLLQECVLLIKPILHENRDGNKSSNQRCRFKLPHVTWYKFKIGIRERQATHCPLLGNRVWRGKPNDGVEGHCMTGVGALVRFWRCKTTRMTIIVTCGSSALYISLVLYALKDFKCLLTWRGTLAKTLMTYLTLQWWLILSSTRQRAWPYFSQAL